jgi:hypothetical protein
MKIGTPPVFAAKTVASLFSLLGLSISGLSAYISETVMMPMRDGTQLATDIYYPFPGIPTWTTILTRTPYSRYMDPLLVLYVCDLNGYALAVQSLRGTDSSQGNPSFFLTDGWGPLQDGYDAIEWLADQWWSDGQVTMWGASAFGMTQYYAAGAAPPHLVCCAPMIAAPQLYQQAAYQGGEFRKCLVENWLAYLGTPWLADSVARRPNYDSIWGWTDLANRYDVARYPIYHLAGWYDLFTEGALDAFAALESRYHNQKLLIGPWGHGDAWGNPQQGDLTYPSSALGDTWFFLDEMIAWYDYWTGKKRATATQRAARSDADPSDWRVMFYLMGDCDTPDTLLWNHWVIADTWPLPDVNYQSYYLRANGRLDVAPPGANERADTFRYDPLNPCPTIGGREYLGLPDGYGPKDQRPLETRSDVLVYTTPALDQPVTIAGKVKLKLFGSSDRRDTDWAVRLCDVYPDGRSILVTDGALMARHRHGFEREDLLTPGAPDTFEIDLWSTALVFNTGHRIRVSVTSSNYPRFERNPNTGAPFHRNDTLNALVATNVVSHDQARPTQLLLPIWAGGPVSIADPDRSVALPGRRALLQVTSPARRPEVLLRLPRSEHVELSLLDVSGRHVARLATGLVPAGANRYQPDRTLPAGVYYVRLKTPDRTEVRKLVLTR